MSRCNARAHARHRHRSPDQGWQLPEYFSLIISQIKELGSCKGLVSGTVAEKRTWNRGSPIMPWSKMPVATAGGRVATAGKLLRNSWDLLQNNWSLQPKLEPEPYATPRNSWHPTGRKPLFTCASTHFTFLYILHCFSARLMTQLCERPGCAWVQTHI